MKRTPKPKPLVQDQYENQRQYNSYQEQSNNSGYTQKDLIELSLKPLEIRVEHLEKEIFSKKENKKYFWGIIISIILSLLPYIIKFIKYIVKVWLL